MKLSNLLCLAVASIALSAAAAQAQNVPNYTEQGGVKTHVRGELDVESGGVLNINAGAALQYAGKGAATANVGNSYTVTLNQAAGVVTTDGLTTAAGSAQTVTINDSLVTASSIILHGRNGGTNSAGTPSIKAVPGAGTITFTIDNKHASAAFNGTFILSYVAF